MAKDNEEQEQEEKGLRSQMYLHEGFVTWYAEEHGIDLETVSAAEVIAHFAAKRNAYRKSEFYSNLKAEHAERIEAEAAQRAEAREQAKAERAAAREAAKAEKAAKAAEAPAKKAAAKATKAPAKKTAKKAASKASAEDPFA